MAEYKLDLIANTEGFMQGLHNAQEGLEQVGQEAIQAGKATQKAFGETGGIQQMQKALKDQFVTYGKYNIELDKVQKNLRNFTEVSQKAANTSGTAAINASKGFNTLTNSVNQISRELPNFAQNAQIGFMAVSNNIPILVDEINKLKRANEDLAAQGKPTISIFKQIASAIFSFQTLITAAIAISIRFADEISNFVKGMFGLQVKTKEQIELEEQLQETRKKLIETTAKQVVAIEGLTKAIVTEGVGTQAKVEAYEQLKKLVPELTDLTYEQATSEGVLSAAIENQLKLLSLRFELEAYQEIIIASKKSKIAKDKIADEEKIKNLQQEKIDLIKLETAAEKNQQFIFTLGDKLRLEEIDNEISFLKKSDEEKAALIQEEILRLEALGRSNEDANNDKGKKEKEHNERMEAILNSNNANRIAAMQDGYFKERAAMEENQRKERILADKNGLDLTILQEKFNKERIDLDNKYNQVLREITENAIEEEKIRRSEEKQKAIDAQMDFIDDIRQLKNLELDIEFETGVKSISEAKRIAAEKLKAEIEYNQSRIALLKASGGDSLQIKALELEIIKARNKISDLGKDENPLLKALGLDLGPGELGLIKEGLSTIRNSLKSIADDFINSAIKSNDNVIKRLDDDISKVQDNIEKQEALRSQGLANNLTSEQKNLDALEEKRREALEKDKKLQREKLTIDGAVQLSSLITASANMFKAYSPIPVVGVPLAIAAIATMFGAFAFGQIKARQAVNQQSFKEGGFVKGKRHSQGGERYYSESGNLVEIEEGEHVTKRAMSQKYRPFLEAINTDRLNDMLLGTGVQLSDEKIENHKRLKQSYQDSEAMRKAGLIVVKDDAFRNDFNNFAKKLESKPNFTIVDGWEIEQRGNRTIRRKL